MLQPAVARFEGFRASEHAVSGTLVGYTYDEVTFEQAQGYFDKTKVSSHRDLVVAFRPGEADVIGFNVEDSVTRKTVGLSPGHVADRHKKWFVVLKRVGF